MRRERVVELIKRLQALRAAEEILIQEILAEVGDKDVKKETKSNKHQEQKHSGKFRIGDRVRITNKVTLPAQIRGTRHVCDEDKTCTVTSVTERGDGEVRVNLRSDKGNKTWRLSKNIEHIRET